MARHESQGPKHLAPTLGDIERLAGEAFATVPLELRRHVANIVFRVEDFPDEETEQEMGLESPFDLLGLYRGVALPHQSATFENSVITAGIRVTSDTVLVLGNVSFDTLRHELTHVVTKAAGESALGSLPAWLDEGTAVYSQSDQDGFADAVKQAIDRGSVLSVRSITSAAGDPSKVNLFYGESWSLFSFLLGKYPPEKFAQLYSEIKKGNRIDSALQAAYGFDQDGLEDAWRASNGLPPRTTPQPTEPQSQATAQASGASQSSASQQGSSGASTGTIIAIVLGGIALAGTIAFAGWAIARRLR